MATQTLPFGALTSTASVSTAPHPTTAPALLSDDQVVLLLDRLEASHWRHSAAEIDDPISMLYEDRALEWMLGWDTTEASQAPTFIALVWEKTSWKTVAEWSLYKNGRLCYRAKDNNHHKPSLKLRAALAGGASKNCQTLQQLLSPITQGGETTREETAEALSRLILNRPSLWPSLRPTLITLAKHQLNHPEWPTLDVSKIERLACKTPLFNLLKTLYRKGVLCGAGEKAEIAKMAARLRKDYETLAAQVHPLASPTLAAAKEAFDTVTADTTWKQGFASLTVFCGTPSPLPTITFSPLCQSLFKQ